MTTWKIGTSGFYNHHWKGIFYPEDLAQKYWFRFYCENFNTLELNVTFYRFPSESMLNKWYRESTEDFSFSVKAPRLITHYKKFNDCGSLLNDFYSACENGLKNKLGNILFQFPASVQYDEQLLELICNSLKSGFNNVIEFRHFSWWKKEIYERLSENKIVFCTPNYPGLPQDLVINDERFYMRLHGNPHLFYTAYETEALTRLASVLKNQDDLKTLNIFFNNTAGTAGILNALELKKIIENYKII